MNIYNHFLWVSGKVTGFTGIVELLTKFDAVLDTIPFARARALSSQIYSMIGDRP